MTPQAFHSGKLDVTSLRRALQSGGKGLSLTRPGAFGGGGGGGGGQTYPGGVINFALARLTPSGALDRTYSGDGKLITRFESASLASTGLVQSDGKIVAAGAAQVGDTEAGDFAITRYNR
ncbi:MAG: hypothetical protein WKH64_08890 [Chloroflexia bacterium]